MRGWRGLRQRGGGIGRVARLLALLALALQSLMPLAHAAAMAAALGGADPGTIVICTAEGPQQVHLAEDGTITPVDRDGKLPPACPGCPVGAAPSALLPVGGTVLAIAIAAVALPPSLDPAAAPSSPRYPPSHPRAPPTTV
jgi:hypothetical protein